MKQDMSLDKYRIRILFLMLLILPINNILLSSFSYYNIKFQNITIILYGLVFLYGIITSLKTKVLKKDILLIMFVYLFYALSYFFTIKEAKPSYLTVNMQIIYYYYIPFAIIFVSHIKKWELLFTNIKILLISDLIIILSFVTKLIFKNIDDYMVFSYDLLPICGLVVIAAFHFNNKKQIAFSILAVIELLLCGSRGALAWLLICATLVYLYDFIKMNNSKKNFYKKLMGLIVVSIISVSFVTVFLPKLLESSYSNTSYIIRRINMGNIMESNSRMELYKIAENKIVENGFSVNGLFYDRTVLPNNMYAHNFILETYLSFGFLFGSILLLVFVYILFKSNSKCPKEQKYVLIFFFTTLFLRYMVSGSIFSEGKFMLFIWILLSYIKKDDLLRIK